jgi:hypothetical protein
MQHAIDLLLALILGLFHVIIAGIAATEGVLRTALVTMRIGTEGQNIVLLVVLVALIIGAIRFFGGIFAILITIVLVLMILHVLLPGLGAHT